MKYGLSEKEIDLIKEVFLKTPEVMSVFIYGSRAKNTFKRTSDIDLAVVFQGGAKNVLGKLKSEMEDLSIIYEIDLTDEAEMLGGNFKDEYERTKQVFYLKGWTVTTLGEVAELQRGFDLPIQDRVAGDFPLMVSNGQDGTHREYKVKAPGVITGRSGTLGQVFFVDKDFWPLNTTLWVKDFHGNDAKFVFYLFKTIPFEKFNAGSGVPTLNRNHIHPFQVSLPPLPEQRAIATVLSALDDKIELLRKNNKTLESIAQILFKRWFVEYEFLNEKGKPYKSSGGKMIDSELGEIPAGWRVGRLGDVIQISGGGTPKTNIDAYWNGDIPWFSVVDAPDGSNVYAIICEKHISKEGLENSSTKLLPANTTIITARGTVGKLALTGVPMAMNQSCYGIRPKNNKSVFYVYMLVKDSLKLLKGRTHGAVFDTITSDTLNNLPYVTPIESIVDNYENAVRQIFDKILHNNFQIQTLSRLRDSLLPRLMKGELRVKGLDQC